MFKTSQCERFGQDLYFFLKKITFIQQGCIQFIKIENLQTIEWLCNNIQLKKRIKKKVGCDLNLYIKGLLHTKMKILSLITYPQCRSIPVKALIVFGTQFKIFWMKTGRLVTVPLTAK